jgi:hypothetical protein
LRNDDRQLDWLRERSWCLIPLVGCGATPEGENAAPETASKASAEDPQLSKTAIGGKLAEILADVDPPRSYEMTSVPPQGEESMTMLFKMDGKTPQKVKMMQPDGWMIVDMEANATYAYEPSQGMIMKMPLAGAQGGVPDPSEYIDPDAQVLGRERLDGTTCWVIASQVGNLESKVWVGADDGLPRQFETDEGLTRFVYSRINKIKDSEFDLPSGLEVVDMVKMMQRERGSRP